MTKTPPRSSPRCCAKHSLNCSNPRPAIHLAGRFGFGWAWRLMQVAVFQEAPMDEEPANLCDSCPQPGHCCRDFPLWVTRETCPTALDVMVMLAGRTYEN